MFYPPADTKMNILLPVESVVLSYIPLLLFLFDQVMNVQAKQYIIWQKTWKTCLELLKGVIATYCCHVHFGNCRIVLLEVEDSDISLETGQSSPQLHLLDGSIQHVVDQYQNPPSV